MSEAPAPEASRCPLCGQPNRCAMEIERETGEKQSSCWCSAPDVRFSPELLAKVPPDQRGRACICARCAAQAAVRGRPNADMLAGGPEPARPRLHP